MLTNANNRYSVRDIGAEAALARLGDRKLRDAWGEFISRYEWDFYATLTPRFPDCSAHRVQRESVNGFIRRLAYLAKRGCPWMRVIERSPGGIFHGHLFGARTADLSLSEIRGAWTLGHSYVERYDANRGAAYYVAKTLHRRDTDWEMFDCSKRMPPRRRLREGP